MPTVDATIGPVERTATFAALLRAAAHAAAVDPYLLAALVIRESGGNPYAIRCEPGYWQRHAVQIVSQLLSNKYGPDDRWLACPDLVCASYGLCQVMYPTAVEHGLRLVYPTELLEPVVNLRVGAELLARHLADSGNDVKGALYRYNGGADDAYPARVLAWRDAVLVDPDFPRLEYVRA